MPLAGCSRGFFTASGQVSSDGGVLGAWSATPDGCTRDPFDGLPAARSSSLATLVWVYAPNKEAQHLMAERLQGVPLISSTGAPFRLEISRLPESDTPVPAAVSPQPAGESRRAPGPPLRISLNTQSVSGQAWTNAECTELRFDSSEQPPDLPGGRPALGGHLVMDCQVRGSHVRSDLRFDHCDF